MDTKEIAHFYKLLAITRCDVINEALPKTKEYFFTEVGESLSIRVERLYEFDTLLRGDFGAIPNGNAIHEEIKNFVEQVFGQAAA